MGLDNASEISIPVKDNPKPMEIIIIPREKKILVKIKWRFTLLNKFDHEVSLQNVYAFVIQAYFIGVREAILKIWNQKFQIIAQSPHAHDKTYYNLVFQIENVTTNEDWEVCLHLTEEPGKELTSWSMRKIHLWLNAMKPEERKREITFRNHQVTVRQVPAAHEFGHIIGNAREVNFHHDEYFGNKLMSEHDYKMAAYNSIMNIGNKVNIEHVDYILTQLNSYSCGRTVFTVKKIH